MPVFTNKQKFENRVSGKFDEVLKYCLEELDALFSPDERKEAFLSVFKPKLVLALERDGHFPTAEQVEQLMSSLAKLNDTFGELPPLAKKFPHLAALILGEFRKGEEPPESDDI